jgi:hypothetical protein
MTGIFERLRHSQFADDMQRKITMAEFLSLAWNAANDKARELKWIV